MKDPINFQTPFQSGEGTCYPIKEYVYYNTQYSPMFGNTPNDPYKVKGVDPNDYLSPVLSGGKRKLKMRKGGAETIYSNGVDLNIPESLDQQMLKGGKLRKKTKQSGGNLGPEKFSMFGDDFQSILNEKFSSNNMGITFQTQAGGKKKKSLKGGQTANSYYTSQLVGSYSPTNVDSGSQPNCGGSKKKSKKFLGGDSVVDQGSSFNANRADGSLGRLNSATAPKKGGGIHYRGADKPDTPSNFSDGIIFHPEWKYTAKGGKKSRSKQKGGDNIPLVNPTPFGVATSDPAGVQVQMGYGDHVMKATKDLGGMVYNEFPDNLPGKMGSHFQDTVKNVTSNLVGGKKSSSKKTSRKQKGGQEFSDAQFDLKQVPQIDLGKVPQVDLSSWQGKVTGLGKQLYSDSGVPNLTQKASDLSNRFFDTTANVGTKLFDTTANVGTKFVDTTASIAGNLVNEVKDYLPGKFGQNLDKVFAGQTGGRKKQSRKQKGGEQNLGSALVESAKEIVGKVGTDITSSLPHYMGQNLNQTMTAVQGNLAGGKKSSSKKQSRKHRGGVGYDLGVTAGRVGMDDDIRTPGHVPLEIASSVSQGAQTQMYGSDERIRGQHDIVMAGTGVPGGEAIQAQLGDMLGGKKRKQQKKTEEKKGGKKSSEKKRQEKKGGKKKATKKSLKGGDGDDGGVGSDFALTLASRGPANYPDGPSADRFRYFTKTANFIPNSMLKWYAAPISTGFQPDPNPYPQAYNDYCGGKSKSSKKQSSKKKDSKRWC